MFGGMNPKDIEKAMKRMGIQQQEVDATEVLIRTTGKTIRISNPKVAKINMMGQHSFQISGQVEEIEETPEITSDDVAAVMQQANCSEQEAKDALKETSGDIAQAILKLQA